MDKLLSRLFCQLIDQNQHIDSYIKGNFRGIKLLYETSISNKCWAWMNDNCEYIWSNKGDDFQKLS